MDASIIFCLFVAGASLLAATGLVIWHIMGLQDGDVGRTVSAEMARQDSWNLG